MKNDQGVRAEIAMFDSAETVHIGRDAAVLERFYMAYYDDVVRYVARREADPHDVADVVADTFVAAVEAAPSFDSGRGRALPWLIGIARNTVRNFQRQRRSHGRAVMRLAGRRWLDNDDVADLVERIDRERSALRAAGLLELLSGPQRELVELVDLQGFEPAEAAQALGISAGLARVNLHRARTVLRRALSVPARNIAMKERDR